jgi:hypothetical protein
MLRLERRQHCGNIIGGGNLGQDLRWIRSMRRYRIEPLTRVKLTRPALACLAYLRTEAVSCSSLAAAASSFMSPKVNTGFIGMDGRISWSDDRKRLFDKARGG